MTEDRSRKSEGRSQKSEDRREIRKQLKGKRGSDGFESQDGDCECFGQERCS